MFVVDIGGITTDVLLLRNGKPDLQVCRSLESGVITMNNDIIGKISAEHDMKIEDEHISAVLLGRETILPDCVKKTIRECAQMHANGILDQLRELQVDLRTNPVIFIGGGSALFRPLLEHSPLIAQASFVSDRTADLLNAILCCRQVHTNAYQKKNGDKPIFDMACLRIFCMKRPYSLCIHYVACMDKYFGTDRG